jgi:hypothetical protein
VIHLKIFCLTPASKETCLSVTRRVRSFSPPTWTFPPSPPQEVSHRNLLPEFPPVFVIKEQKTPVHASDLEGLLTSSRHKHEEDTRKTTTMNRIQFFYKKQSHKKNKPSFTDAKKATGRLGRRQKTLFHEPQTLNTVLNRYLLTGGDTAVTMTPSSLLYCLRTCSSDRLGEKQVKLTTCPSCAVKNVQGQITGRHSYTGWAISHLTEIFEI